MFSMDFDEINTPELDDEILFDPFLCDQSQFLSCDSSGGLSFSSNVITKDVDYEMAVSNGSEEQQQQQQQPVVATRVTTFRAHQRPGKKKEVKRRPTTVSQGCVSRHRPTSRNAARERSRVKSLRSAFLDLQNSLPSVPPNTKLSKLDILVLATTYIAHLMKTLDEAKAQDREDDGSSTGYTLSSSVPAVLPSTVTVNMVPFVGEERHHRLQEKGYLHPVRKWPMRSRLYAGVFEDKRGSASLQQLALPDVNYSMPLLDANLDLLFSFSS